MDDIVLPMIEVEDFPLVSFPGCRPLGLDKHVDMTRWGWWWRKLTRALVEAAMVVAVFVVVVVVVLLTGLGNLN